MKLKKNFLRYITISLFFFMIFSPFVYGKIKIFFDLNIEPELHGFVDTVKRPKKITYNNFRKGKYQKKLKKWYEQNLPLASFFIKNYNSIRFLSFKLLNKNKYLGNDNFIHGDGYINSFYSLEKRYDYSIEKNRNKMKIFINDLIKLQNKLSSISKYLYIYLPPSKVELYPNNVPKKFIDRAVKESINPSSMIENELKKTNLNFWMCNDIKNKLKYPSYYSTGAHWSRTYESIATRKIISDLKHITGKSYRNIKLGKVIKSDKCLWRDCDYYNLLNMWPRISSTYYEYKLRREFPKNFDKMNFFIAGDSFADGLKKDILDTYPDENIYLLSRNKRFYNTKNESFDLYNNLNTINLKPYVDASDVIIIEMIEPEIINYAHGIVKHLLKILNDNDINNSLSLNNNDNIEYLDIVNSRGVYGKESNGRWMRDYASFHVINKDVKNRGLEIDFIIPNELFKKYKNDKVHVYLNNEKIYENTYDKAGQKSIIIPSEKFKKLAGDDFEIAMSTSKKFIPSEFDSKRIDSRILGVYLTYIGIKK